MPRARGAGGLARAIIAAAALLCVLGGAGLAAASTTASYSFKVTGAGSGSLHNGHYGGCLNGSGQIDVNDIVGTITHFTKDVVSWDLTIDETHNGTFHFAGSPIAHPTTEFSAMPTGTNFSAVQSDQFFADKGTVTIHGEGATGSISATFSNTHNQQLKITGHWTCIT
ncbi:MAG: hypothetical protein ABSB52_14735 [Acidimicrobiales bacterium]|jgi:hypothetical protein